uniref:NAD-specific glutamate dehydrogenase n=1 Tax=Achlya klebsiana TaxID=4767 RepID=DHE2_ACHKL|nr:RecName: Full=NAD-specific glutamate dehydrogenase; Short=NAD-GDH [Achlya klebsiana]AAA17563.1 NAD-specific glutamate dehydrogenase [Achlya klebsiana]
MLLCIVLFLIFHILINQAGIVHVLYNASFVASSSRFILFCEELFKATPQYWQWGNSIVQNGDASIASTLYLTMRTFIKHWKYTLLIMINQSISYSCYSTNEASHLLFTNLPKVAPYTLGPLNFECCLLSSHHIRHIVLMFYGANIDHGLTKYELYTVCRPSSDEKLCNKILNSPRLHTHNRYLYLTEVRIVGAFYLIKQVGARMVGLLVHLAFMVLQNLPKLIWPLDLVHVRQKGTCTAHIAYHPLAQKHFPPYFTHFYLNVTIYAVVKNILDNISSSFTLQSNRVRPRPDVAGFDFFHRFDAFEQSLTYGGDTGITSSNEKVALCFEATYTDIFFTVEIIDSTSVDSGAIMLPILVDAYTAVARNFCSVSMVISPLVTLVVYDIYTCSFIGLCTQRRTINCTRILDAISSVGNSHTFLPRYKSPRELTTRQPSGSSVILLIFLLLGFEFFLFSGLVVVEPVNDVGDLVVNDLLVAFIDLALELFVVEGVAEVVGVVFKTVLGFNADVVGFIFRLVLFSFLHHAFNIILGEATLVVGNGNLVFFTSRLFDGRHVQDTVGINVEGDINLWNTTRHWRNTIEGELPEQVVVTGHRTLTFKHLNQHTRLVVSVGGESLRLLGWHSSVTLDEGSHDTTSSFQTKRERSDIKKQQVLELFRRVVTAQNGSLDCGTESNSFIRVDRLAWFLAVEEVRKQLLDLWDTGGTTDKDDFMDLALGELRVTEDLFNRFHSLAEVVTAHVFETGTGDGGVEINTIEERVDFNVSLGRRRKSTLGTFTSGTKTAKGTLVLGHILAVLALEFSGKVVDEAVIEIFTTQVGITSSSLDFEDTFFNGQKRHIEGTTTKIENENIAFTTLLVKTVGNGGTSRFVNDTKDVKTSNGTSILGSLTLRVVEISWDGNDSVVNSSTNEGFSNFLHLDQNHRGNFFRLESLSFTLEFDGDLWLVTSTRGNLEWPVLNIGLSSWVVEFTTDQTLSIEHSVGRVHGNLVLSGITNKTFAVSESNVRWGGTVTLIVGNNFNTIVLPDTDTRISRTEIDTDGSSLDTRHACSKFKNEVDSPPHLTSAFI